MSAQPICPVFSWIPALGSRCRPRCKQLLHTLTIKHQDREHPTHGFEQSQKDNAVVVSLPQPQIDPVLHSLRQGLGILWFDSLQQQDDTIELLHVSHGA